jgi:hypothetical protein
VRDRRKRTLRTLQDDHRAWTDIQFPNQTIRGLVKHLKREVDELHDAMLSDDPPEAPHMECADIQLLLVGILTKLKVSAESHIENCDTKLEICKKRIWPAEADADGVFHHTAEAAR